jgi:hypothetical protein
MMPNPWIRSLALAALVVAAACTGSLSVDPSEVELEARRSVVAHAGPDQTVAPGTVARLDGSGSVGSSTLTYQWTQTQGEAVAIQNATSAVATFIAPSTTGVLGFTLTVSLGKRSSSDSVQVTVGASCTPTTCADLGKNCGTVSDGCGGMITCGVCTSPLTCGGGGTSNVCGGSSSGLVTFIAAGSLWRYLDTGTDPGTDWRNLSFDDSGWKSGAAELGYGDGDERTVVSFGPSSSSKYITTFFRQAFNVDTPGAVSGLTVKIRRDDGAVVYLNGVEVFRTSMPTGAVSYSTLANGTSDESTFFEGNVNAGLLVAGKNVIAVEVHQGAPDSSDLSFDLALTSGVASCTPTTCAAQGKNCGTLSDGCGGTLNCGGCVAPSTCGGSGVANVCGTSGGTGTCTDAACRITSRDYPSIFQAWAPATNLSEDKDTTIARHDLVFSDIEFFGLQWNDSYPGLATGFTSTSVTTARSYIQSLRTKNPNLVMLGELRFYNASTNWLPSTSPWWLRDSSGNLVGSDGYYRLNYANTDLQNRIATQAAAAMAAGLDGVFLDWWPTEDDARIALVSSIRAAIGANGLILVNTGASQAPRSAPYVNGMFMEGFGSWWTDWKTAAANLQWGEVNLRAPRITALEGWYKTSRQDLALMRRVTLISLLYSNGYVLFGDPNSLSTDDHLHDWYPFWSSPLGKPMAPSTTRGDGTVAREFSGGTAVFNPDGNATATVTFSTLRQRGSSGATGTTFSLVGGDGDLFLTTSTTCTPTTCAAQGKTCGTLSDGCGGSLTCGTCASPQSCGGGGVANVCGGGQTSSDPIFVGAGDIASSASEAEPTAKILDSLFANGANPNGIVFAAGDNAYDDGSLQQYSDYYQPTWGRHKARTRPVPGNHEYHLTNASGYFQYFGNSFGTLDSSGTLRGYYSYDLGTWHVIALDSNVSMSAGSEQEKWLRADLAKHSNTCTVAYWHRPRYSSGYHGSSTGPQPLYQALYDYNADLIVVGHDHMYERFAPMDAKSTLDSARGIAQFLVGTGGASQYAFNSPMAGSLVRYNGGKGVVKFTLHPTSYSFEFISEAGKTFTDSGNVACH